MNTNTQPSRAEFDDLLARFRALETQYLALLAENARLRAEVAQLQDQLAAAQKNSGNSSKPPSSDIVKPDNKPPIPEGQDKRTIGGQIGHTAHFRELFTAEKVSETIVHPLETCPCCGGGLRLNGTQQQLFQQVDIVLPRLHVTEHQFPEYWCDACHKSCKAEQPLALQRGGMAGPMLITLVAYIKSVGHGSFSFIRLFLRDVCGLTIARSTLDKIIKRVTQALDEPYAELLDLLPGQERVNIDETGHPENGKLLWTWCLNVELFTLYRIQPSRGSGVLLDLLGEEFDGVIGCDMFSAYKKFMKLVDIPVQFCLAHLIRDVRFLCGLPDPNEKAYGNGLLDQLRNLFSIIHRREAMTAAAFEAALLAAKASILKAAAAAPAKPHSQRMAKRFNEYGESYFTFITTPGMEPTNNVAERAIRFVVLDRMVTQGTRGESGRRWCERIWTVLSTCHQRGVSVFSYLGAAIGNFLKGRKAPSLLTYPPEAKPASTPA